MASISLLGSVFLPASVLEPFALELTRRGHAVGAAVPHVAASVAAVLDGYAAGIRPGSVLVAHSNAGNFV
ncbi:MAG TPA: hypothetical protein VJR25_16150, partial [Microbacterium sp.]|uniref:hypothetical protein n=1 Tax=Microbacterium sp. TaxID=51671 RepID=UPI002B45FFBE